MSDATRFATPVPALRIALKTATRALHDWVDASFSGFDLESETDRRRFLLAHHAAMRLCQPVVSEFARRELGRIAPDFSAMLASDLREADVECDLSIENGLPDAAQGAGVAYVVLGSRVGVAALAKRHRDSAWIRESHYFGDREGLELWRAYCDWSERTSFDKRWRDLAEAEAIATFELFQHTAALAASAPAQKKRAAMMEYQK